MRGKQIRLLVIAKRQILLNDIHVYAGQERRRRCSTNPFATSALERGGWPATRLGVVSRNVGLFATHPPDMAARPRISHCIQMPWKL